MTAITIIECSDIEERWFASLGAEHARELAEHEAALDHVHRLHGTCERCRDEADQQLVILGNEAICAGCVEAMGLDFNREIEETWVPVAPAEVA